MVNFRHSPARNGSACLRRIIVIAVSVSRQIPVAFARIGNCRLSTFGKHCASFFCFPALCQCLHLFLSQRFLSRTRYVVSHIRHLFYIYSTNIYNTIRYYSSIALRKYQYLICKNCIFFGIILYLSPANFFRPSKIFPIGEELPLKTNRPTVLAVGRRFHVRFVFARYFLFFPYAIQLIMNVTAAAPNITYNPYPATAALSPRKKKSPIAVISPPVM